jgi:hypothetical protein
MQRDSGPSFPASPLIQDDGCVAPRFCAAQLSCARRVCTGAEIAEITRDRIANDTAEKDRPGQKRPQPGAPPPQQAKIGLAGGPGLCHTILEAEKVRRGADTMCGTGGWLAKRGKNANVSGGWFCQDGLIPNRALAKFAIDSLLRSALQWGVFGCFHEI